MEKKESIKISLPTTICIFIIFLLILALAGTLYYYNFINKSGNSSTKLVDETYKISTTNYSSLDEKSSEAPSVDSSSTTWKEAYETYLKQNYNSAKNTTTDIDNDGTPELLIRTGTSEADMKMLFYTCKNNEILDLGSIGCGNTIFYEMNTEDYLLGVYGHMGYEETYKIYISNNSIQKTLISSKQINPDEGYQEGDILLKDIINE